MLAAKWGRYGGVKKVLKLKGRQKKTLTTPCLVIGMRTISSQMELV